MNDDPTETSVVYACVTGAGEHLLRKKTNSAVLKLKEQGIITEEELAQSRNLNGKGQIDVKLHMTVINTKRGRGDRRALDVTPLLADLGTYDFGEVDATEIHLSLFHAPPQKSSSKYYTYHTKCNLGTVL
mmetsp:Transcript_47978/g.124589  ORF Transcript_47978/g.124589 Transcript_47978/m.124589 type:complete len:130 (-) Transcript_47978:845-1234(-)